LAFGVAFLAAGLLAGIAVWLDAVPRAGEVCAHAHEVRYARTIATAKDLVIELRDMWRGV
jgi:hypothetical protein